MHKGEGQLKVPHPIPYQGSKRNIAKFILPFFPPQIDTLIEPFAGSAAVSIAAAFKGKASRFILNDINRPLMSLWNEIINNPKRIVGNYEKLWNEQKGREREFYDLIRDKFNKIERPDYLLYLLARCVKASIRYNTNGEFNQSPDNRRKGRNPYDMRNDIIAVARLFHGRTIITSIDYTEVFKAVSAKDLIYMDPPYQGVCTGRDQRYYGTINHGGFIEALAELNSRKLSFILSYDGRRGDKIYGMDLPTELELHRIEIKAGRSTQSTLLGRSDITYESIYLSKALIDRLGISSDKLPPKLSSHKGSQLLLNI
jgi:DNA adenine methylase